MADQWAEVVKEGEMVGLMMTDLSSAYDMVNFPILQSKLKLFGLDERALKWMETFMFDRKQSTCVDGKMSQPLTLHQGVPQGSNLSPFLYIIYTSDVPDLCHFHPVSSSSPVTYCEDCGSIVSYMDDSSFSVGCESPEALTERLSQVYKEISSYMSSNMLILNDDKTHLIVFTRKADSDKREDVYIEAGNHIIRPTATEKLLGCHVAQDMK